MSVSKTIPASFLVILSIVLICTGCARSLKYNLNPRDTPISSKTVPLKVVAFNLTDIRPEEERNRPSREKQGSPDAGDYTYDRHFKGIIAEEITSMMVKHFRYARIFSAIERAEVGPQDLNQDKLNSYRSAGFDAALTGEIENFYGYYDRNVAREFIFMLPFLVLCLNPFGFDIYSFSESLAGWSIAVGAGIAGTYLESMLPRDMEWKAQLHLQLILTSNSNLIWEDRLTVSGKAHKSVPGLAGPSKKFKLAITSLRQTIGQVVKSLARISP